MLPLATDIQIKEPPPPLHCTHGREVKKRAKEGDHLNYVQYLKRQQFAAARGGWPRGRVALTNNRSVRDSDTAAVDAAARSPLRWWRPSVTRVRMRCLFFRERRRRGGRELFLPCFLVDSRLTRLSSHTSEAWK